MNEDNVLDVTAVELMELGNVRNQLSFIEAESMNIATQISVMDNEDTSLSNMLEVYNQKYGLNYNLTNLSDFFKELPNFSDTESRNLEYIIKDIGYKVSLILKTKLILSLSKMIDRSISLMALEMESSQFTTEYALENIERLWGWLSQINGLLEESEIHGLENKIRLEHPEEEDPSNRDMGYDPKEILDLMMQLKKSS